METKNSEKDHAQLIEQELKNTSYELEKLENQFYELRRSYRKLKNKLQFNIYQLEHDTRANLSSIEGICNLAIEPDNPYYKAWKKTISKAKRELELIALEYQTDEEISLDDYKKRLGIIDNEINFTDR